ncbi:oxidoreductase [Microtetraspora sp. NBRC 13810]|uniref:Gfo/Idh/MocA family protein n=1 Tax=Microtetraspora sp. NBRC 13810 TaxID=3030990 RepID=UPI0024A0C983|nr:Gfo/Idh/MocA family oxidoreductase [Microtetraspora sp. NBRC 13810]GLW05917.1 oxidoreductase [Microtetraspora sp. NBRC 13810]
MEIRVGVIGASPDRGWAARAHVPALRALPGYALTAVATSRAESAREAARRFGAAHAFTDPRRLAEHPDVDLVAITVKVPAHAELVRAALEAGKHVYCEWPLARTTEEARALADLAGQAGVRHVVGLQARHAPAVGYARELLAAGRIGRVTSATVYATRSKGAGTTIPAWAAYTLDRANGAGLLEVAGGHTLDAVEHLLGEITTLSAALSVQRPGYTVEETGEAVEVTGPDHLQLHGALTGGAALSAHIHDAKVTDARTRIEIAGTEGDLAIVSGALGAGGVQMSELRVLGSRGDGSWEELPVPVRHRRLAEVVQDVQALNVARLYAGLADDLRTGARTTADFGAALHVHRLLDAVRRSAATGTRQTLAA